MTTLITGGASQSGLALAKLLKGSNRPLLFASRSGRVPDGFDSVKFDWVDPTTFSAPFDKDSNIKYAYLLPPNGVPDELPIVKPFIDIAVEKGVKRFVLMATSSSGIDEDSAVKNNVQEYLEGIEGVEYVSLRPTWFIENLTNLYGTSIKGGVFKNSVATASIPFIGVEDVGQAAFDAIVAEKVTLKDPILIGPESITYSQVAEILSSVLGRPIVYEAVSREEAIKMYTAHGAPVAHATFVVDVLEAGAEAGNESRWKPSNPKVVVGKVGVRDWVERNKAQFV